MSKIMEDTMLPNHSFQLNELRMVGSTTDNWERTTDVLIIWKYSFYLHHDGGVSETACSLAASGLWLKVAPCWPWPWDFGPGSMWSFTGCFATSRQLKNSVTCWPTSFLPWCFSPFLACWSPVPRNVSVPGQIREAELSESSSHWRLHHRPVHRLLV